MPARAPNRAIWTLVTYGRSPNRQAHTRRSVAWEEASDYAPPRSRANFVVQVHRVIDVVPSKAREAGLSAYLLGQPGVKAERAESGSAGLGQARGQAAGHRQPVHQGQDGIAEVVLPGRARPDVLDQPRAVRADGAPDGGGCFGRAGHVVEAVERQDEGVAVVAWQILRRRRPEFHVLQPVVGRPAAGAVDRVL